MPTNRRWFLSRCPGATARTNDSCQTSADTFLIDMASNVSVSGTARDRVKDNRPHLAIIQPGVASILDSPETRFGEPTFRPWIQERLLLRE